MNNNPFLNEEQPESGGIIRFGKVASASGGTYRITWDGEESPQDTTYARLSSYTPQAGDRVMGIYRAGSYTILGKVVS